MSLYVDPPQPEEPPQVKRRGCLFMFLSAVVIVSLLATSVASLVWFVGATKFKSESIAGASSNPC